MLRPSTSTLRCGSTKTTSASAPGASVPLRGHMPNSLAGFVELTETSCCADIRCLLTPSANSIPMLVWTFETPAGILLNGRDGSSFCAACHGAWSVA
jgi:hypothetical protein